HNDGTASFTLSRGAKLPPLHVTLQVAIDPTDGHVTGTITGGGITATLSGDRTLIDLAHPVPVGTYTLLFPTLLDEPAGANSGSASLVISAKGLVTVIGRLADATSFTATSNISKDGGIPVFAKIGAGLTTLSGVLTFNVSAGAPEGTLRWLHGTDTALAVIGCYYSPPVLNKRVLDTLNATSGAAKVTLSVGGLAAPIVKTVTISTLSRVTVRPIAADKLLITIVPALGTFSGTFVPPGTIKTVPISGIFFEDLNAGLGLFITPTGAVGHVRIEAAP
ncbi:MAG: hypothetical protein U0984_16675, partial [Prosthecobacter sp.]|nr:hypothetical protein [Prosthecobacter sp.]